MREQANPRMEAWSELDRRFRRPLFTFFVRRVHDRSEAEDLTQEVFARLARPSLQLAGDSIQAYVFVTAANLLKDRNRRLVRASYSGQSVESAQNEPNLVEDRNPERVLLAKETLHDFLTALDGLGERTRDVFILSRVERMHQGDIAKLFGISVSAVEKHVMKALSLIGQKLAAP